MILSDTGADYSTKFVINGSSHSYFLFRKLSEEQLISRSGFLAWQTEYNEPFECWDRLLKGIHKKMENQVAWDWWILQECPYTETTEFISGRDLKPFCFENYQFVEFPTVVSRDSNVVYSAWDFEEAEKHRFVDEAVISGTE